MPSNIRVAALVCRESERQLQIAVHIPAKSKGLDDYSLTTITGTVPVGRRQQDTERYRLYMREAVCEQLNLPDGAILQCVSLLKGPREQKGKSYYWFFVRLTTTARPKPNPAEIKTLHWYNEFQLVPSLQLMSDGRREMVTESLEDACRRGLFGARFRSQLQKLLRAQMYIKIPA